uniref:Uncharacterized protein n=1 Tax=Nelumbo nucifera TaxID=4432 RepID=A0A822ZGE8_NELNU|nr:TPA_asm: hypothetical protein HUJ06_001893 [Nelumbo nucifera]
MTVHLNYRACENYYLKFLLLAELLGTKQTENKKVEERRREEEKRRKERRKRAEEEQESDGRKSLTAAQGSIIYMFNITLGKRTKIPCYLPHGLYNKLVHE